MSTTPAALNLKILDGLKFCVDCDHVSRTSSNFKCRAPENQIDFKYDLVTGEKVISWKADICQDSRHESGPCGPTAILYKKRDFSSMIKKSESSKVKTLADEL